MTPVFKVSKEEWALIVGIADRFESLSMDASDRTSLLMDIEACHCNGCPLDLRALLDADGFDLVHDVAGIRRHINRETGKLGDCFWPRYAKQT